MFGKRAYCLKKQLATGETYSGNLIYSTKPMSNGPRQHLKHANIVFNVDIDELVLLKNNATFFEAQ